MTALLPVVYQRRLTTADALAHSTYLDLYREVVQRTGMSERAASCLTSDTLHSILTELDEAEEQ